VYTLRLAATTLQGVVFNAGTVFLLRALQATAGPRIAHGVLQAALAQAETCIRYLREMGRTWASSKRTGDMLQAILNDRLRPAIVRRLAHRGEQIPAAATAKRQTPAVSGAVVGHELIREPAPSYAAGWDSRLDPAAGWSEPPLHPDFFAQMQNAPAPYPTVMGETAFPELAFPDLDTSGFLLPNFDYFRLPELWNQDFSDVSARALFSQ